VNYCEDLFRSLCHSLDLLYLRTSPI